MLGETHILQADALGKLRMLPLQKGGDASGVAGVVKHHDHAFSAGKIPGTY